MRVVAISMPERCWLKMTTSHIVNANATKKERVFWKVRRRVQTKGLEGGLMGGVEGGLEGGVEGGLMGGVKEV